MLPGQAGGMAPGILAATQLSRDKSGGAGFIAADFLKAPGFRARWPDPDRSSAVEVAWRADCEPVKRRRLWPHARVLAWALAPLAGGPAGAAPPAAAPQFEVDEYRIEGNTVLSEAGVDEAVEGFLGPGRTAEDVEHARAALEAAYARQGYPTVSVEIPLQQVSDGVVVLKVTERRIGRLRVRGSRYYSLDAIKGAAPALAEGKVPNMPAVQRDIVALNQWPGRTVTPALRPGAAPGTVDVDLQVQDQFPGHASFEVNNQKSQDTRPLRLSGSLGYDNLWQRGDSANLTFQVAPQNPSNATVVSGSYLFHVPNSNVSLLASYLHSDSNVTTVGSTTVIGRGDIAGFRVLVPLGFDTGFVHTLSAGLDYKHFDDNTALGATTTDAPVTYYPLTVAYQASWSGERSQTDLLTSLVLAFQGLGSNTAAFQIARAFAVPGFAYLRTELSRTETLPHDIQLYGRLAGQITPYTLISNEQFPVGGIYSVRGYLEGEALGDYGGVLQTEIRSPSLAERIGRPVDELRFLAFVDAGAAAIHQPLPQQAASYTLASTGAGVRVHLSHALGGELLGAVALANGPATKSGAGRILFRLNGDF
jgi:hemolysin activation/secretion protein